jgi:hypothetical protein
VFGCFTIALLDMRPRRLILLEYGKHGKMISYFAAKSPAR